MAVDGGSLVDCRSIGGLFGEKHRLVCGNRIGEITHGECRVRDPGFIQPHDVVRVARETLSAQPLLQANDTDRRCLFPERPFCVQHPGRATGKSMPSRDSAASQTTPLKRAGSPVERESNAK